MSAAAAVLPIEFNLTGFGEFYGVKHNPTTTLMESLEAYLEEHPLQPVNQALAVVNSCSVLEVSGVGSRQQLNEICRKIVEASAQDANAKHPRVCVLLHFGVDTSASCFHLEQQAYNEANFRVPDQRGWTPAHEPIMSHIPNTRLIFRTDLPLHVLHAALQAKGHQVELSQDPGRYLCNWIYCNSLSYVADSRSAGSLLSNHPGGDSVALPVNNDEHKGGASGGDPGVRFHSLFVHVPAFDTIPLEDHLRFAKDLLEELAGLIALKYRDLSQQQQQGQH
jgi:pyroglutamyl-peptidase